MRRESKIGEERTPQKKCRTKITRTRRVTLGPVYSVLKGTALPSWSSSGRFSIDLRVSRLGKSLLVLRCSSELILLPTLCSFV